MPNDGDSGDGYARLEVARLLAARDDDAALAELRSRGDSGDQHARQVLAQLLAARGDHGALAELRGLVLAGAGGGIDLLLAYRKQSPERRIVELNCEGYPKYVDDR